MIQEEIKYLQKILILDRDLCVVLYILKVTCSTLGSPLINGIFLVQKMCIYSCVTLSTTLLMRAVQFNERSACDASTFTSCITS